MSILLSAHKIQKSFASRVLFRGLTFAVEAGDRIGLIGPNGAGKSTLMRILAGRIQADSGEVSLSRGLRIGLLEQTPEFAPGLTIYEALIDATTDRYDGEELAHVETCISKLDLNQDNITSETLVESLSGGWKKRVALARELVRRPDLLLLDEPTNHLDVEGIIWLEEFLREARFATITITHDRLFLQKVANRVFDLDPRYADGLLVVNGEYVQYLEIREELMRSQERREVVLRNTLRRETEWLRRGAKARTTKQQARIGRADDLKGEVDVLQERNLKRTVQIDFQEAERNPQKLVEAKSIAKSYGGKSLFKDFSFIVTPKTRLGLLGPNGCGKSTLIRCLLGLESVDSGEVRQAEKVEIAFFEQHRDSLDLEKTVLRNICPEGDYVNFRGQYIFARSYLDRFLFRTEQHDMPVAKLSGGEQARLRVAQMMLQPANVLVLDEPTNDLDMATMAVLEEVLGDFNGAVILVTHDRYFLDQVSNHILSFGVNDQGEPELNEFAGYQQWEDWFENQAKPRKDKKRKEANGKQISAGAQKSVDITEASHQSFAVASDAQAAIKKRKLSFNEKRELEGMESSIQQTEARLVARQAEAEKPENLSNAEKLAELYAEISSLQAQIDQLYARWAELES